MNKILMKNKYLYIPTESTKRYTHVSKNAIDRIKSPLDELKLNDQ